MTHLLRGLCSYRKICLSYSYIADENPGKEQELDDLGKGPPSRVFLTGLPEYSPKVELYSSEEFPLRDDAVRLDVRYYLAVPVFESVSRDCVGVLELLFRPFDQYYTHKLDYHVKLISTALEEVELRTSDYNCHLDMENDLAKGSTGLKQAFREIQKAINMVCKRHKLPFAQTWTPSSDESNIGNVMSTTKKGYYWSDRRYSLLKEACTILQLLKGHGVVWRALLRRSSCFCRDITQLRITDYSFAHTAKLLGLTSSFAICLQSNHTGDDIYVLELFLPTYKTRDRRILLDSLLATMKQHLKSFKIVSGQKLGKELHVEVLRVSGDDLHSFVICRTATSGSLGMEVPENEDDTTDQHFSSQQSAFDINMDDEQNTSISLSSLPDVEALLMENDGFHVGYNSFDPEDGNYDPQAGKEGNSSASEFGVINRNALEKCFGMKLTDAAVFFSISKSTLKRQCRKYGIKSWPQKRNKGTSSPTSNQPVPDHENHVAGNGQPGLSPSTFAGEGTTLSPCRFPRTSTVSTSSIMTIKAEYGEVDIIKFSLPFSSAMTDLEKEVTSRLNLEIGNIKIRYQDEDGEWILLTRDEDLRTMESMGKTAIRMSIINIEK